MLIAAIMQVIPRLIPIIAEELIKVVKSTVTSELSERMDKMEETEVEWHEKIERKMARLEDQDRRSNLVFMGLQPCAPSDVPMEVLKYVNMGLRIPMTEVDIVRAHYLGKSKVVLCKFTSFSLKQRVYQESYHRPYNVTVKEDFSRRTRRVRERLGTKYRELQSQARATNANPPKLVAENIFFRGDSYTVHEGKRAIEITTRGGGVHFVPLPASKSDDRRKGVGWDMNAGKKAEEKKRGPIADGDTRENSAGAGGKGAPSAGSADAPSQSQEEETNDDATIRTGDVEEKEEEETSFNSADDEMEERGNSEPWRHATPNKRPADGSPGSPTVPGSRRSASYAKLSKYRYEEGSGSSDQNSNVIESTK